MINMFACAVEQANILMNYFKFYPIFSQKYGNYKYYCLFINKFYNFQ